WGMSLSSFVRDLKYAFVNGLTMRAMRLAIAMLAIDASRYNLGLVQGAPAWVEVIALLLTYEFFQYWVHRICHEARGPVGILQTLNSLGARHGVGRVDIVENRLVGMKSHGVYETPGGALLYRAHAALEQLCLDKETLHFKQMVGLRFAELVYNGQWFTPLREALTTFVNYTERNITGTVRLKLYKGNIILAGRKSPYSLYREDYVTFDEDNVYNQADAEGFIKLFGLPLKVEAMLSLQGRGVSEFDEVDYDDFKRD
ncbi:MAG TPA: argininosuccinate synthase, partial [Giesbergeria sp.]|nr:argininosuccinate synthase [Giesbergeria sp.]